MVSQLITLALIGQLSVWQLSPTQFQQYEEAVRVAEEAKQASKKADWAVTKLRHAIICDLTGSCPKPGATRMECYFQFSTDHKAVIYDASGAACGIGGYYNDGSLIPPRPTKK